MNMPASPSAFLEDLDLKDAAVAEQFALAFAVRLAVLYQAFESEINDPEARLAFIFLRILGNTEPYTPTAHPTFEAWLYKSALDEGLSDRPHAERTQIKRALAAVLSESPHYLTDPEIAAALNIRENAVAKLRRSAPPARHDPDPPELDLDRIARLVRNGVQAMGSGEIPQAKKRQFPLQESIWLLAGLGVVLIGMIAFARSSDADLGVAIFPSPTPPLPFAITVDNPDVHAAPPVEDPFTVNSFENTMSQVADNGEYIVFISTYPYLVENDTNSTYDIFMYEIATGKMNLVSQTDDGTPLSTTNAYPAISSDGQVVAFLHFNTQEEPEVWVRTWKRNLTEKIPLDFEGGTIRQIYALSISGDGTTVAFLGTREDLSTGPCAESPEEYACADLYVWEREYRTMHRFPLGLVFRPWFESLPLSNDGSVVGLTLTPDAALWERLDSPNEMDAVLYDWSTDSLTPLNRTPDGKLGASNSRWPDISGDGRFALIATETEAPATTLIWLDLETGERRQILPPTGESLGFSQDQADLAIEFGNQPALSNDGSQALFFSLVPAEEADLNTMFCGEIGNGTRKCMGLTRYFANTDTYTFIELEPYRRAGAPVSMLRFPSLSADGRVIAFAIESWEFNYPCPDDQCSTIWIDPGNDERVRNITFDHRELTTVGDHTNWRFQGNISGLSRWIKGLAVDPAGNWIAAGDQDGTVRVFIAENYEEKFVFTDHSRAINALSVSADGTLLAAGAQDNTVMIWNMDSGSLEAALYDHPGIVLDVAFAPNGEKIAVGTMQALWIWTRLDGDFILTNSYGQDNVSAVAFSPDGRWLAFAQKNEVWIRRVKDGEIVARLGGHTDRILDTAFSPVFDNGYTIATASKDKLVNLWAMDLRENDPQVAYLETLQNNDWVHAVAFSPDGETLATGSFDSFVNLWSVATGNHLDSLQRSRQDQVLALAFLPQGNQLFAGTVNSIRIWNNEGDSLEGRTASRFFSFTPLDFYVETALYGENWFRETQILKTEVFHSFSEALSRRALSGFPPPDVPEGFTIEAITVYRLDQETNAGEAYNYVITTNFQPARLTILRTKLDPRDTDWPVASSAEIIDAKVSGYPAEMIMGGWGFPEDAENGEKIRRWNAEAASIWLRWEDENGFFSLYYDQPFNRSAVPASETINFNHILRIAENLYP